MSESLFDEVKVGVSYKETTECSVKSSDGYTKENLFNRAVELYEQMETIKSDLKQLKEDFTYDEDVNPKGMDKNEVKDVIAFANKYVAAGVEKVIETAEMYKSLKEELIGE